MEAAVKPKTKVLLVGGMEYNVPPQIKEMFDVVRHVTHGMKFQSLPQADYVFVITEWASHNLVETVKAATNAKIIPLPRGGWEAIKLDLRRRSILPPDEEVAAPVAAETPQPAVPSESLFSAMSESEVWKKYGASIIEAAQTTLKPKEVLSEDHVLEALSLSGVPKDDCKVFLVKLQMKGILDPVSEGRWRLMAAPGVDFENDRVKVDGEVQETSQRGRPRSSSAVQKEEQGFGGSYGTDPKTGRRQVRSPELLGMIAGLNKGPYSSKREIFDEMRKYTTFDGLSDWQVRKYIDRAIEAKIVDDTHAQMYINHDNKVVLTRAKAPEPEPEAPEKLMAVSVSNPVDKALQDHSDKMAGKVAKEDAEKGWCFVVEAIKKQKDRLGGVLSHCRIEWMGDNKVLVVFVPSALAQWQKFVESTENWGLVTSLVQEKIARGTAVRFMADNGLRV
jgi:hypothetical protein